MADLATRCPTGIPGLDELLGGGLPRQRSILLSGPCGSGKTTLALQFLYNGITKYSEPGILISLEQDSRELKSDMMNYGMDLGRLEMEGKLVIIDASLARVGLTGLDETLTPTTFTEEPEGSISLLPDEFTIDKILDTVSSKARRIGAKRIVFDSLPAMEFLIEEENENKIRHIMRQMLLAITFRFKALGLSTLIITESDPIGSSPHYIESYVVDGVLALDLDQTMDMRKLTIKKMRGVHHTLKPQTMYLTDHGARLKT